VVVRLLSPRNPSSDPSTTPPEKHLTHFSPPCILEVDLGSIQTNPNRGREGGKWIRGHPSISHGAPLSWIRGWRAQIDDRWLPLTSNIDGSRHAKIVIGRCCTQYFNMVQTMFFATCTRSSCCNHFGGAFKGFLSCCKHVIFFLQMLQTFYL
jgi:hypothetical protein